MAREVLSRVRRCERGRALRALALLAMGGAVDQREQVLGGALVARGEGARAEVGAGGDGLAGACWGGGGGGGGVWRRRVSGLGCFDAEGDGGSVPANDPVPVVKAARAQTSN